MALPLSLLSLAPSVYQGISGLMQRNKAGQINPQRPTYTIPDAMHQQVGMYRQLANNPLLPGHHKIIDQQRANSAQAINSIQSAAGSGQDVIAGASRIAGSQSRGMNDLLVAGAQNQQRNQQMYGQSLGQLAQYQDQAFNVNEMIPYMNDLNQQQALTGAANHNIYGGLNGFGQAGPALQYLFGGMFGTQNGAAPNMGMMGSMMGHAAAGGVGNTESPPVPNYINPSI